MGETAVAAPPAESASLAPEGIVLDNVDWDYSHLRPAPGFMTEAQAPEIAAAETSLITEPAEEVSAAQERQDMPSQPAEAEPEPPPRNMLKDSNGQQWQDLGPTDTGMHKILSPDGRHTKFITPEQFQHLTPAEAAESEAAESEAAEAPQPIDNESQPDPDPEKQAMREEISSLNQSLRDLTARVAELEGVQAAKAQPEETGRIFTWVTGTYEPVRVINRGTRNGESFVTVMREGYDQPVTVFADEYEYWQSQAAKQESAPQDQDQARKRFSEKFQSVRSKLGDIRDKTKNAWAQEGAPRVDRAKEAVQSASPYLKKAVEPIGVGIMYGQVLAENGPRIAGEAGQKAIDAVGETSRRAAEAVSETGHKAAEAGKETVGVGAAMVQVAGEKTVQAARDTLSQGSTAARMTAESMNSKVESMRTYRRRLFGQVLGSAAIMKTMLFSSDPESKKRADEYKEQGWNL